MRLIDADAIDVSHSDPEVKETLEEAPTVEAIPKAKIDKAIKRMEKAKEGYYFKYPMELAIDIVKEACE